MSTPSHNAVQRLLNALKPDDYRPNPFAEQLRGLANAIEEQSDKAHRVIKVTMPPLHEPLGELCEWPGHEHFQLDHSGQCLNDILCRGVSVTDYISATTWNTAEEFIRERYEDNGRDEDWAYELRKDRELERQAA